MTTYYLSSVDGDNGSDGLSWANAFATFKYAVETVSAVGSGPHTLLVDSAHSESLAADITATAAGVIYVLCVNRGTGALATGAVVGAQATNYSITIAGAYLMYFYGLTLRTNSGAAFSTKVIYLTNTDGQHAEYENCTFVINTNHASAAIGIAPSAGSGVDGYARFTGCSFIFGGTSQKLIIGQMGVDFLNCDFAATGSVPTTLLSYSYGGQSVLFEGCDLSAITGTLVGNSNLSGTKDTAFANCKLGSGVTIKAAASTLLNKGNVRVRAFNCDAGDNHYAMYDGDAFGETTVSTSIYASGGAKYDGTNGCSWKIVTTANCNYYTPYVSPWIDAYHSGTSAITPNLEILRDGSSTAYQDDEVWGEWSYQGTSGSTRASFVSDRMTPLGSAANQTTGALGAGDWTGENATAWFGKLAPGSAITPAEIGHIRARVCVGEPSITVYVDPQIRGLS